ncbi:MAG: hypothetical protein HY586_00870 [Candidatus Omnitrophica bacterium]|nr:hypothetical protein [Candidatus Omnitrophota bacterium]
MFLRWAGFFSVLLVLPMGFLLHDGFAQSQTSDAPVSLGAPSVTIAPTSPSSDTSYEKYLKKVSDWNLHLGTHERVSINVVGNTVDLDRHKHSDQDVYLGYVYDFTVDIRHISGFELHSFIERRGRADYDAPLWGNQSINTIFGRYGWYNGTDIFPRVRNFWGEIPLTPSRDLILKVGLFAYGREVGNRIAMGGKYENYGATLARKGEQIDWNLHWEAEDLNNRIHLGKVINQDKVARYNGTLAYFQAADATIKFGKNLEQKLQPYIGWLQDVTPRTKQVSQFTERTDRYSLIQPGIYLNYKLWRLTFGFENAWSLGAARSSDQAIFNSIVNEGYFYASDVSLDLGSFKPKFKWFVASGNDAINSTNWNTLSLPGDRNRAFSVFSPTNTNLTDTHYQKQWGPYVAMAGGYAVNFGLQRPGTFLDPYIFENLNAYSTGFDFTPIDKVYVGIDYWYLQAREPGFGLNSLRLPTKFSKDLGNEIDYFVSYQLTKRVKLSLLGGWFFPGGYYREKRGDTAQNNIFAPTPRRDGKADMAYQVEMAIDITF